MSHVWISGASGFIGKELTRLLLSKGWKVSALVRSVNSMPLENQLKVYQAVLPDKVPNHFQFDDSEYFIHLAYSTQFKNYEECLQTNVKGTLQLAKMWKEKEHGIFVFISSMSAHENATSVYGKTKFQLEQELAGILPADRLLIIRPGFVLGPGGLSLRLLKTIRRLRVIPLFFGGNQAIQVIQIDDLTEMIVRALDKKLTGFLNLGSSKAFRLRDFYRLFIRASGVGALMLPIPFSRAFLFLIEKIEKWGLHFPITSENIKGVQKMSYFAVGPSLQSVNFSSNYLTEYDEIKLEKLDVSFGKSE